MLLLGHFDVFYKYRRVVYLSWIYLFVVHSVAAGYEDVLYVQVLTMRPNRYVAVYIYVV